MQEQIWLFIVPNAFHKNLNKSQILTCNQTLFVQKYFHKSLRPVMLIFAPHSFKCRNLHNQNHFSLIMETWLFWNVGFYPSFLPFYVLRSILEILILGSMTEIWNANVWKDVIFNSYTVSSKWWNMTTKKFLEWWHSKFKCFKLHVAYYSMSLPEW